MLLLNMFPLHVTLTCYFFYDTVRIYPYVFLLRVFLEILYLNTVKISHNIVIVLREAVSALPRPIAQY